MASSKIDEDRSIKSESVLEFLHLVGKLKGTKRTGWVDNNVQDPESVSDHMYRMAIMTFLLHKNDSEVDATRCLKIALVHDLAECIVGDITPFQGITKDEKHKRELAAMEDLVTLIPAKIGAEFMDLWLEYESQSSKEAKLVKDLDRFEMILQAYEYEQEENRAKELEAFFNSVKGKIRDPVVSAWSDQLVKKRESESTSSAEPDGTT